MLLSDLSDQEATGSNSHEEASHVLSPLLAPPSLHLEPKAKKKRSQPGNPDPEAEVIALSPRTLVATNRFVCEICNKGFQRDQNLQLHRRGHNLPWKLRQRSSTSPSPSAAGAKEDGGGAARKRVYVCPEPSCVHHHPSRALGDLTGIKKHFSRKHGEKRWKCERCAKRYAVHSDWKAHVKNCGTREYRCDCGILFSRKDSLVTHRAFCDALAEESARLLATSNIATINSTNQLLISNNSNNSLFLPFSPSSPDPIAPNPNSLFFLPQEAPLLPPFHNSPFLDLPIMTTTTTTTTSIFTGTVGAGEVAGPASFGFGPEGSATLRAGSHRLTRDFLGVVHEVEDAGEVDELQLPYVAATHNCPGGGAGATAPSGACCATDLTKQHFVRFPPVNETWSEY